MMIVEFIVVLVGSSTLICAALIPLWVERLQSYDLIRQRRDVWFTKLLPCTLLICVLSYLVLQVVK